MFDDFAERVNWLQPEGAYAVLARAKALEAQGRDIIHLEVGQPDFATPARVAEAGVQAIRSGRTRYTPPAGARNLRAAIAEVASAQRSLSFTPEEVVVGPGAKPAMFCAIMSLVRPGDEVILPDPGFPSYSACVRLAGGTPVAVPLRGGAAGQGSAKLSTSTGPSTGSGTVGEMRAFDLDEFEARLNERTRMVILNSPSNPTGSVTPLADLERIAAALQRTNAWVLSDEIYSQLVYDGEAPSIAGLPGMRERTVIIDGFSKTYAMTGWRLGYGIMPQKLAERVELLMTHSVGCTADFTQVAGVEALCGDQGMVAEMRDAFRRRRDRTVALLNTLPGVRCAMPQGAFYVFPDVRGVLQGRTAKWLADYLLDRAGVALLAGSDFGAAGEGYLRLSYATSMELIEAALERIRAALVEL